ncbi:MAG: aminotransferase class I/II-fold pyridoxal phosphate-dependent enzyme [Clostridia bacterium]|nr:aminotransferase class I/II-fold pyridoxal phosphate-dependent enzyme [Clostridia bacterium]
MIRFECDYTEGAHPALMQRLLETNMEQCCGYGLDPHCDNARALIRKACENDALDVHFLPGGTQANVTVIAAALRSHQGVLSADTGHIAVHEAGAVEHTGHKVLTVPNTDGKISAAQIDTYCAEYYADDTHDYIVPPAMVYISFPTETGTLYTDAELTAIRTVCDRWDLLLFVDGARLGYGIGAPGNDVTLPRLAALADVFYIGGTKVGALFGEAVCIRSEALKKDFRYHMKQNLSILAKGRLMGVQFETLFENGLYFELGKKASAQAVRIREALAGKGFTPLGSSMTNQQFFEMPDEAFAKLAETYVFSVMRKPGPGRTAFRVCTSWATADETVDALIADINAL